MHLVMPIFLIYYYLYAYLAKYIHFNTNLKLNSFQHAHD
jgi:hypothetical protein